MSAVYVVISINNGILEICEPYAGSNAALSRAFSLAKLRSFLDKEKFDPIPNEVSANGNPRWLFISTSKTYVAVHYSDILINPEVFDPMLGFNSSTVSDADPIVTYDAPYDDNLPGGWLLNKKPATMKDLWETPELVKSMYDLNSAQMIALVKARISKRPNYHLDIPSCGIFNQASALQEINLNTLAGEEIVENEIEWLEELRRDRYDNVNNELGGNSLIVDE